MQDTGTKSLPLYETDFYAWANQQAALLRAGRLSEADIANIVEEIETLGRSEKRELVSRLTVLLMHLLKWRHQSNRHGKSWRLTIEEQRLELAHHMRDNPSLRSKLAEAMSDAYQSARLKAARETGLDKSTFPDACPWSYENIADDNFWPEA